jgi:hypothetical protein
VGAGICLELNKRCRPFLEPADKKYYIDETYIKVKGQDTYLYRALNRLLAELRNEALMVNPDNSVRRKVISDSYRNR